MSKPVLYTRWTSSCAWRVRIALNLKGVQYESKPVDKPLKGKNAEELIRLNPARKIPVFIHNDNVLFESLAIIEYIDEVFSGPSILPKGPVKRAQSRAIALHVTAGIQPLQCLRVLYKVETTEDGQRKWAAYWLSEGLKELEEIVKNSAGKFAVGDELSIADLCIPSILYNARKWGVDLTPMRILLRLESNLNKIPAFEAAMPEKQDDAPKE